MNASKRILCALLCLAALCALVVPAAAEEYTYTVRFYAGSQGSFGGADVIVYDGLNYGDRVTFSARDVTLNDGSKYYIKGIRESGRDNNTVQYNSFLVTKDMDYVVAYGILGNSVAYTIRYVDENGRELAPSETYYGNIGDKPVVAYLLIDDYRPQYYNITGTLKENAAENVFTFVYVRIPYPTPTPQSTPQSTPQPTPTAEPEPTETPSSEPSEETEEPEPTPTPGPVSGPEPAQETPGDVLDMDEPPAPTPMPRIEISDPQELFDLDENLVPFAGYYNDEGEWVYYSDEMPELLERQTPVGWYIGGGIAAAAALGLLVFFLLRRKKKDEEEETETPKE